MTVKRHCCCCISLTDGVIVVGLFGACLHGALFVIQVTYGGTYATNPSEDANPQVEAAIMDPIVTAVHLVGIVVNVLLGLGAHFCRRSLMLPWLLSQGVIAIFLASLAIYFLVLYPASQCRATLGPTFDFVPTENCQALLWNATLVVISLIILVYYIYIVYEFLEQLRFEEKFNYHVKVETIEEPSAPEILDDSLQIKELPSYRSHETTLQSSGYTPGLQQAVPEVPRHLKPRKPRFVAPINSFDDQPPAYPESVDPPQYDNLAINTADEAMNSSHVRNDHDLSSDYVTPVGLEEDPDSIHTYSQSQSGPSGNTTKSTLESLSMSPEGASKPEKKEKRVRIMEPQDIED